MRPLTLSILLALTCGAAAQDASGGNVDPEVGKLLAEVKKGEPEKLRPAVDALRSRGGTAAADCDKALRDLEARRRREWETAAGRIRALAARVGDGKATAAARVLWEESRTVANAWLFDASKFPLPKKQPVDGPEEGYPEAKSRGDAAIGAYKAMAQALDGAAAPTLALFAVPGRAAKLREATQAAAAAHADIVRYLPDDPASAIAGPTSSDLEGCLLAIAEGDFNAAAGLYLRVPEGWSRLCAFHAYGLAIMARNAREPCGMEKMPVRGIEGINTYRMALGISPLWHNPKLGACAQQHADEQLTRGYFSHTSPVPGYVTMWDRAKKAGYAAGVTECISTASTASSAIEMWKWDGGHHRAMIHWEWTEVGCSHRGPCTLNPGGGEPGAPPGIRF